MKLNEMKWIEMEQGYHMSIAVSHTAQVSIAASSPADDLNDEIADKFQPTKKHIHMLSSTSSCLKDVLFIRAY